MNEFPERWLNIYEDMIGIPFLAREDCDGFRREVPRLGVLHIRPDGTTEMEQP